ncbi:MAG: hypothetical protein AB3N63_06735 [Puniceicoccaceae bacterium]
MSNLASFKIAALACCCFLPTQLNAVDAPSDRPLEYVLDRYIENMGGRASIEQIKSIRLSGTITYDDGQRHRITVLKKKPNLARIVLDAGFLRVIQAYNGQNAWFASEAGKNVSYSRMEGKMRDTFIREAPLENVLFHPSNDKVTIELGEDVQVAMQPCYQVIARFADGTKTVFHIDKGEFVERRILEFDTDGKLLNELIPGKFETYDGVVFAMQIVRLENGEMVSTLTFDELETNVGILDTAFNPPVEIP